MSAVVRRWRPRLRWRVAIAFSLVSMLITGALAGVTWQLAAAYLLDQRQQGATQQASINARLVLDVLRRPAGGDDLPGLLTGLAGDPDTTIAIRQGNTWTTSGRRLDPAALPAQLLDLADNGVPATQRIVTDGIPVLAVSLPLGAGSGFVQLFPLLELDRTLRFLSAVMVAGVAASTLVGLALGRWAGRRALRPLAELTSAAARVAAGDLTARLPVTGDGDLAPLATTFNSTATALEHRVDRDVRFAADVSHELRSPLTTLVNAVAVLTRRHDELPAPAQQAVELLDAEIHRFHTMVTDLLEISREEALDPQDLELCDPVDVVRRATHQRQVPPIEVVGDPAPVLGDRRRLDRVVGNLLDNADAHGGGVVRVAVLERTGPARARIEIDDAGPGVPAELRTVVFERFSRGRLSGRRESGHGTGLGLALVARHVRLHRGAVWIEQAPAGGARVVVEVPAASA